MAAKMVPTTKLRLFLAIFCIEMQNKKREKAKLVARIANKAFRY
jgi:hypothetical protein